MNAGYATLLAAYDNRLAASVATAARGERAVGYVGNTVPVELIAASGCQPVRIAPVSGDASHADRWVEHFSDLDVRLIFADYLAGAYNHLSLLIIPRSSESQHKLYLSLREAWRTGVATQGPALWLYDILHTQRDSSHAYGLARTADLQQQLAKLSGQASSDAALRDAIAQGNATRLQLRALQQRRQTRDISGEQAHIATGALRFLSPAAGHAALAQWLQADEHRPATGPRLLVKGCPLDHAALHAAVEAAGGRVVLEDDDWGSRAAEPLIDDTLPPLQAVFEHVWRDVPCARLHPAPLAGSWFARALNQAPAQRPFDAVLFYLPPPEDVYGWSFPAERDAVKAAGLPWLLLRHEARAATPLIAELRAFMATLPARNT